MEAIARRTIRVTFVKGFFHAILIICLIVLILHLPKAFADDSGYVGQVWDKNFTQRISGVEIIFKSRNEGFSKTAISNKQGLYRISLPAGKYFVTVEYPGFKTYSSHPGVFVVSEGRYRQGNIFIEKK